MTTTMPDIDIDKPAKYPIVLSAALQGKGTKELFTSIRYNHKPPPTSDRSLTSQELRHATNGDASQYDLSYNDGSDTYMYQGTRTPGDGQYVLIFDPAKEHFVLHQVDSSFDMNLTSMPRDQNPARLRESYDQIQSSSKPRRKSASQPKSKSNQNNRTSGDAKRRKVEKLKKAKTPPREPTPDAEDEDSDDGLTIEYPGGAPPQRFQAMPSRIPQQSATEEISGESDADAEFEEEDDNDHNRDVDVLELPSPAANILNNEMDEEEEEEVDLDLAAELEQALEKETGGRADESSESEEE